MHVCLDFLTWNLIEIGTNIIPIEVKAGTRGAMQSLHLFIEEKNAVKGIRTSLENFGRIDKVDIYPIYAVSKLVGGVLFSEDFM